MPNIYGKFSLSQSSTNLSISCNFLITAASEAALISACDAAESALKEINKDTTIVFGGSTEYSFSHSGNTGFLARPNLRKLNNKLSTATSRPYSFSLQVTLPFAQYGGRRSANFVMNYTTSRRRRVSFRVEYTALDSPSVKTAQEAYEDGTTGGKAWASSILTGLGGTYELVSENFSEDQENKIVTATIVYQELLTNDTQSSTDYAAIKDARSNYSVHVEQVQGVSRTTSFSAVPILRITLSYSCAIDRDVIATDTSMEAVYRAQVKPWLVSHAFQLLGLSNYNQASQNYIIETERFSIDPNSYRVNGTLVLSAPKSLDIIMSLREQLTFSEHTGVTTQKIWDGVDDTFNAYIIGRSKTLQRLITVTKYGSPPDTPTEYSDTSDGVWVLLSRTETQRVEKVGVGTKLTGTFENYIYSYSFLENYQYIKPVVMPEIKLTEVSSPQTG